MEVFSRPEYHHLHLPIPLSLATAVVLYVLTLVSVHFLIFKLRSIPYHSRVQTCGLCVTNTFLPYIFFVTQSM